MIVVYKRRHVTRLYTAVAGNIVKMDDAKANELIGKGIVERYFGEFPPKNKVRIELKDITNNGKNYR